MSTPAQDTRNSAPATDVNYTRNGDQARTAFIRTLAGLGGRVGPCPNRTPCDSDGLRLKVVSVCVTVSESEVSYPLGVRSHRSPSASVASGLYFYLLLLVSCVTVSRGGT